MSTQTAPVRRTGAQSHTRESKPSNITVTRRGSLTLVWALDIGLAPRSGEFFLADEAFYAVLFLQFSMCYQAFRLVVPGPNFGVFNARLKMPRTHPKLYL